jgi:hypothetical protein
MTTFTPGPWRVLRDGTEADPVIEVDADNGGCLIAKIERQIDRVDRARAALAKADRG